MRERERERERKRERERLIENFIHTLHFTRGKIFQASLYFVKKKHFKLKYIFAFFKVKKKKKKIQNYKVFAFFSLIFHPNPSKKFKVGLIRLEFILLIHECFVRKKIFVCTIYALSKLL